MTQKYEITVGIECHVQLATKTKLFSEVDNDARDKEPNACVSPVDYGLPGMLPRLNQDAITLAVRAGLAMNAQINLLSRFDRKHYYYPDLPKGYQITQLFHPIIGAGHITLPDGTAIRIEHAHLEEDAAKSTHYDTYSLVDYNRAGTPLVEIVSMPDIHSAQQAHDYCKELWRAMTFAGVTLGDLYNGNMRFDVNISLALPNAEHLGTRAEVKNLNSFRSVARVVEYEYQRQAALLDKGKKVIQETRGWSDATGKTTSQRSKEEAQDYRYMPEPDIPPVHLTTDFVEQQRAALPLLPQDYRQRFHDVIPSDSLEVLLDYPALMYKLSDCPADSVQFIAKMFVNVLLAEEKSAEYLNNLPSVRQLTDLATMTAQKELSSTGAKDVFMHLFDPQMAHKDTKTIAKELGVIQENDLGALEKIIDEVLALPATQQAQADFKAGQEKVIGFLVGQVMKASHGQANPSAVQQLLRQKLS